MRLKDHECRSLNVQGVAPLPAPLNIFKPKMRFSTLIAKSSRLLDADDAAHYVGGKTLLNLFESAGWVKPACRRHKLIRYDCKILDAACDRLQAGEWPE